MNRKYIMSRTRGNHLKMKRISVTCEAVANVLRYVDFNTRNKEVGGRSKMLE